MQHKITRHHFLRQAVMLAGAGLGMLPLVGCGDDDDDDGAGGTGGQPPQGGTGGGGTGGATGGTGGTAPGVDMCESDVELVEAHIHEVTVPPADVEAGAEKTYMLSNVLGHTHEITVTAADFATLASGQPVTVSSTQDSGHAHDVTVTCS